MTARGHLGSSSVFDDRLSAAEIDRTCLKHSCFVFDAVDLDFPVPLLILLSWFLPLFENFLDAMANLRSYFAFAHLKVLPNKTNQSHRNFLIRDLNWLIIRILALLGWYKNQAYHGSNNHTNQCQPNHLIFK